MFVTARNKLHIHNYICFFVCMYVYMVQFVCMNVCTLQFVFGLFSLYLFVRKLQSLRLKAQAGLKNVDENNLEKTNFRNDIKLSRYITNNHSNSTVLSQQTPVSIPELYSTPSTSSSMEKSWGKAPARISM